MHIICMHQCYFRIIEVLVFINILGPFLYFYFYFQISLNFVVHFLSFIEVFVQF